MATIKPTESGQEYRLAQLKHLRETKKDLSEIEGLKNTPEWSKLVRLLRRWSEFAKNEERNANRDHDAEDIDASTFSKRVTRSRQKQVDFDFVADILDKTSVQIESVDAEIERIEKQYKDAKEFVAG